MTDFRRYLRAKRTVDDRALDRRVIEQFHEQVAARAADTAGPLRILEVGAGIGTMLARLVDWDLLPAVDIRYTAVDLDGQNVATIPTYLREWAAGSDATVTADPLTVEAGNRRITVDPVEADATSYTADAGGYDLLIGAALLDIIDRERLLTLLDALAPGGLYYFPITFDGATRFQPSHPADRAVESHYHAHMDAKLGGDSRAGGDVLERLQRAEGVTLSAAAGSDWIVRPVDGVYPADEEYFLRHILDSIEGAVGAVTGDDFDALDSWLARRREQIAAAELVYCTHQLDFFGRVDGTVFGR